MAEEATRESSGPSDRAREKYEIVVASAPLFEQALRWFGFLIYGLVTQGDGIMPGGQRIRIKDRGSEAIVDEFTQGFGSSDDVASRLHRQLDTLSVDEFEHEYLRKP